MTKTTDKTRLACRARRIGLGFTQSLAARLAGIPQSRWCAYESGTTPNPKLSTILAVMRALQTRVIDDVL